MIPRLVHPTIRPSRTKWPERSAPWSADLFLGRPPFRKLVVMVDAELAEIPFAIDSPHTRGLLFDLLRHPFLKVYRFADGGPPNHVDPDPSVPEEARADCFPGWVVIKEDAPEPRGSQVVFSPEPGSYALGGVMGNLVDVATADFRTSAYSELSPFEATQKRAADALAYQVATQVLRADLYITERPYLSAASWLHRDVTITDVRGGLAFIGFYLRSQDEYPVSDVFRFNRGLYSWVGTRELLPDGWRWFSACVQHSQGSRDDGLLVLGGSVFQRFQRALDARDMIHLALNKRQNNDTQQDALSQLDVVLLLLMAALDVTARVAHRVLGLTSGEHDAGWQRARWVAQVRAAAPNLMAAVSFPPANHILTILRLLRNTVHGAALQGMAVVQAGSTTNLVALPADKEQALLDAMNHTGGTSSWGVSQTMPGRFHLDPGALVDRLFPEVVPVVNAVMRNTPVESLPHVSLQQSDCQPPVPSSPGAIPDSFHPGIRASIRWQLGF